MKIVNQVPTQGQFIICWVYKGEAWSDTIRICDGEYERYVLGGDGQAWEEAFDPLFPRESTQRIFIVED